MKNKIIELFEMLPLSEQLELLRELNNITNDINPIIDLNLRCQSKFKKNIGFKTSVDNDTSPPVITAEVTTPFGNFIAKGSNKKLAKIKASDIALAALEEIGEKQVETGKLFIDGDQPG